MSENVISFSDWTHVGFCPQCEDYIFQMEVDEGYCVTCRYKLNGSQGTVTPSPTVNVATVVMETFDAAMKGIGGAPTRATTLPTEGAERKKYPVASGVMDYFPDALAAIANVSWRGNEQHNPGQPLHWDRSKSQDEADTLMRHFLQRGTLDTDGVRHSAKVAWRALAMLQKEIESER